MTALDTEQKDVIENIDGYKIKIEYGKDEFINCMKNVIKTTLSNAQKGGE